MGKWTARGGWSIEAIVLDRTPCYRVLRHGYRIAYCASLEELAELLEMNGLDLGDLVEDDEEPGLVMAGCGGGCGGLERIGAGGR